MIRILHLFVTLPVGGAENLLLSTVRGLDGERFKSVVCCIRDRNVIGEELAAEGYPVVALDLLHQGGWDRRIVDRLERLIRQEKINLVHCHLYHAGLYGRLAARRAGVPAILSIHNTYVVRPRWYRRLINRYLLSDTACVLAGSNEIAQDLQRWDGVPGSKLEVIPNTVNLSLSHSKLTQEQARQALTIPASAGLILGTVGRMEPQKGHALLLRALRLLSNAGRPVYLLLVGDGSLMNELRTQAEQLGISDKVQFLGLRRDLGDLFRAMDLFVMPSLWEGLSLAMLSAMAAGLPVVATRVGGVEEVLGDDEYGLTLPSGDASLLAERVAELADDPDRMAYFAERGRVRVESDYSDQVLVDRLQEIYERVLMPSAAD